MKQPVGPDFFAEFHFPGALRASAAGQLCFSVKRPRLAQNRYDTSWWLYTGGALRRLALPKTTQAAWWQGEDTLLLCTDGGAAGRRAAESGLPVCVLQTYSIPRAQAAPLLRVPMQVEDAAPLGGGRWLLLARWQPAVQAALRQAGGDEAKAAAILRRQAACDVLTELPFWENGAGMTARARRRLYLWDGAALHALSGEATEAENLCVAPGGAGAWFSAATYRDVAPQTHTLQYWDAETGAVCAVPGVPALRHHWLAPLPGGGVLLAGADGKAYGLNQNPAFYRVAPGGGARCLYDGGAYSEGPAVALDLSMAEAGPSFAAEDYVYWASTQGETACLVRIHTHSGAVQALPPPGGGPVLAAAPAPGGAAYVIAMPAPGGPEVYRTRPNGGADRLTSFNAAAGKKYALAVPRPLCAAAADGTEIRGFVLAPPGGAPAGGKAPAILNIHGGPKTVYSAALMHETQYWAAQGFAVLYCNPRGSCGRGDAFADIRGRYGETDAADLLCFLGEALRQNPWIDENRLGVTGGSYGGYMTNWLVGHTGRFAAAASQRGIASWGTLSLLSDIGWFFVPDQTGAPLHDAAALWRQSPLAYAQAVHTPTLFLHSDEDCRCPAAEGLQMYAALKARGVPTRLCLFHGENHELSRSGAPQNRVRRLEEIAAWFRRYLMEGGAG